MPVPGFDVSQAHRYFAVECNNQTWDWLEKGERTADKIDAAIHSAHAAYFHWSQIGTPLNRLRAACLLANVYAVAGQGANALRAAQEALRHCDACGAETQDWDWAFARDALARAALASGDRTEAEVLRREAAVCGAAIADLEDKRFFESWFTRW